MKIGICSGYFAESQYINDLHQGHKDYLLEAYSKCDFLIICIDCMQNFEKKYGKLASEIDRQKIRNIIIEFCNKNIKRYSVVLSSDVTSKSLENLKKLYSNNEIIFFKAGDRTFENLPQDERDIMLKYNIKYQQLDGKKVDSASDILKRLNKL